MRSDGGRAQNPRDDLDRPAKIGEVQQAQGDLAAALASYQASLAIRERLAKADPGNAGRQRDLSVSYEKIGEMQQAQGDLAAALASYQASHDIFERLAKADPGNARWQRDLIVSYVKLAEVDQTASRSFLTRALEIAQEMQRRGQLAPTDLWMIDDLAKRIAALAK